MFQRSILRAARSAARQAVEVPSNRQYPRTGPSISRSTRSRSLHSTASWRAEAEAANPDGQKQSEPATTPTDSKDIGSSSQDAATKELDAKKREVVDLTDKWKRSIAEYRNLQEQTKREVKAAREFAIQSFAKDLIESVDNLDRALETVPKEKLTDENKDLVTLHDGLRMTEKIMLQTLKKHGLERFDPSEAGDKFDPNRHEATFQVPQPDKVDGTVFHTQQKGFALNNRVLRAAKVGVVKNS